MTAHLPLSRPRMQPQAGDALPDAGEDIRRAQAGDVEAFERLYRGHVGRVHALALRLTADRARAAELTQDVFVRAWEKLSAFRADSTFASWLHRLTVNEMLQEARADRRRRARHLAAERPDIAPSAGSDARLDLERAIATLPPQARLVFVLHDVEGWRHDEIATLTGNAPGTLRAHLHRARRLLMEALGR